MNLIGKPCLTFRFNTDRPETVNDAKSNILIPPVNRDFITASTEYIFKNQSLYKQMSSSRNIYGKNVGKKIIETTSKLMKNNKPFKWAHEALGLWREDEKGVDYL